MRRDCVQGQVEVTAIDHWIWIPESAAPIRQLPKSFGDRFGGDRKDRCIGQQVGPQDIAWVASFWRRFVLDDESADLAIVLMRNGWPEVFCAMSKSSGQ